MSKSKPAKAKQKKQPTSIVAKILGQNQHAAGGRSALNLGSGGKPNTHAKTFTAHRSKNG